MCGIVFSRFSLFEMESFLNAVYSILGRGANEIYFKWKRSNHLSLPPPSRSLGAKTTGNMTANTSFGTIEALKYEISVEGRGVIDGGRLREQVPVGKKSLSVRKAYWHHNEIYRVGWVYDFDVSYCMVCIAEFGWFGRRHHCRACGYVVCGSCSPYRAKIAGLPEEVESRVCRNCYTGASAGRGPSPRNSFGSFDMGPSATSASGGSSSQNLSSSPIEHDLQKNAADDERMKLSDQEAFQRMQERSYLIAYR